MTKISKFNFSKIYYSKKSFFILLVYSQIIYGMRNGIPLQHWSRTLSQLSRPPLRVVQFIRGMALKMPLKIHSHSGFFPKCCRNRCYWNFRFRTRNFGFLEPKLPVSGSELPVSDQEPLILEPKLPYHPCPKYYICRSN